MKLHLVLQHTLTKPWSYLPILKQLFLPSNPPYPIHQVYFPNQFLSFYSAVLRKPQNLRFNTSYLTNPHKLFIFKSNLLTHSHKEHYLKLKRDMPALCKRLSQYHIASFLGVTPVTLSRIKKNLDL